MIAAEYKDIPMKAIPMKDMVVYLAAMERAEDKHFEDTYTCGDTWTGSCWHALLLDFYGHDYLVTETHIGLVSVVRFDRGFEASDMFDEAVIDHLDADKDWDAYQAEYEAYQAEYGESWR